MFGLLTTRSALIEIASSTFSAPCYLTSSLSFVSEKVNTVQCCGAQQNLYGYATKNTTEFCSPFTKI